MGRSKKSSSQKSKSVTPKVNRSMNPDNLDHLSHLKRYLELSLTEKFAEENRVIAKLIGTHSGQITAINKFLNKRFGNAWMSRPTAERIIAQISLILQAVERFDSFVPEVNEALTIITTPSVATSFLPRVYKRLLDFNWFMDHKLTQIRVEHWHEFERALDQVACGLAACVIAEEPVGVPGTLLDDRLVTERLFGKSPQGFVYDKTNSNLCDGFNATKMKIRSDGRPDLSFLAEEPIWLGYNSPLLTHILSLLPKPHGAGGRFELFSFNSIRSAVQLAGGVGIGSEWNEFSPWVHKSDTVGFFPFMDLPGDSQTVLALRSGDSSPFYLWHRRPSEQEQKTPSTVAILIETIIECAKLSYQHCFSS